MNPQNINSNNGVGIALSSSSSSSAATATRSILKSNYDKDVIRLIGQHLINLGLKQTVNLLLEESGLKGLDHPDATKFQQAILNGDWDGANSIVESLANHSEGDKKSTISELKLLIAQEKFLELLEDDQHIKALKCLRLEISPLTDDPKLIQHLTTLLMCKSIDEVRQKADWPGKGLQSRRNLVEKVHRYFSPPIIMPPKRLNTLLAQAVQLQKEHCVLHINKPRPTYQHNKTDSSTNNNTNSVITNNENGSNSNNKDSTDITINSNHEHSMDTSEYIDLKQDHFCSANHFPLQSRQELDSHKTEVWYCKFSNDGSKLATGGVNGKIKIWDYDPNQRKLLERCTFDCECYSITCLSWSPNDVYLLATGSEDRPDLWVWHVDKEEKHNRIGHTEDIATTTCSWHPSGQKFAAASIKGTFNIYDLEGNKIGSREGVRVQCLSFLHNDPNVILAADTLNRIKAYAVKDMSLETDEDDVLEERQSIMSFTVDKDDRFIAVNVMDQGVHLWDYRLKTLLRMFPGVRQKNLTIYSSFSSPDSTFLASGSEDGRVYIYHINKDQPVAILHGHSRCVNCVTWNPKYPEILVSVSDDRAVRLWAPTTE